MNQARAIDSYLMEKMKEIKQSIIDKGGPEERRYKCPKCRDLEATIEKDENGYDVVTFCECYYNQIATQAKEKNGVVDLFRNKTLKNFKADSEDQKLAMMQAKKYIDTFKDENLVICGHSGTGKTHLAVATATELEARGVKIMFIDYPQMIQQLEVLKPGSYEEHMAIGRIENAELLIIDDLFKVGYREWDGKLYLRDFHKRMVYSIINYRYNNRKPTIVTTELTLDKLLFIDEAIGGRLIGQAGDNTIEFDDENENYRLFGEKDE
jgi:DNA replication protein DnaC